MVPTRSRRPKAVPTAILAVTPGLKPVEEPAGTGALEVEIVDGVDVYQAFC
jgi:hypothetical protein